MKRVKRLLLLIAISIAIAIPSSYVIHELTREPTFLESLEQLALSGDANAMFRMGNSYYYRYGGREADYESAAKWYRMAADNGDINSMNRLAYMYYVGQGVPKNYKKTFELTEMAADKGNPHAKKNLGGMYRDGVGVKQDYEKAFSLFKESSDAGYVLGMENLAAFYSDNKKDFEKAYEWWLKAAEKGSAKAQFWTGWYHDEGKGVEKNRKLAKEWYELAASQGHDGAQRFLGFLYYDGAGGVKKDLLKAGEYFWIASKNGNKKAKDLIAWNVKKCKRHEYYHYKYDREACLLVAHAQHPPAMHSVALIFYRGREGYPVDWKKAFFWANKSALAGYDFGQFSLIQMYSKGEGVPVNNIEAYAWASVFLKNSSESNAYSRHVDEIRNKAYDKMSEEDIQKAEKKAGEYIKSLNVYKESSNE